MTVNQPTNAKHNNIGTTAIALLSPQINGGYVNLTTTGVAAVYKWDETLRGYVLVPIAGAVLVTTDLLPFPVWKTGITTGTTAGQIVELGVNGVSVEGWHYENQMVMHPDSGTPDFSRAGDSGSAVVSTSLNRIACLLWGGSGGISIASPIGPVMAQLGITVATSRADELQQPAVVPSFDEALARLKSDQGIRIASFLMEYGPVVRNLIYTDRRVGLIWARNHGHEICNEIIENVATKSIPLPAKMAGAPTKPALEEFGDALMERGRPDLRSAIEAIRSDIEWLIDRPYKEVVGES